ncbi:tyrosine-protein kinase SYK-like [Littorina saxatilis]|uniref:non-specific protein-tyrosine kinase n=1 Tax=Littorina saxatilis TaxID=31220 RepID=A0AAN9G9R9_9CAEN
MEKLKNSFKNRHSSTNNSNHGNQSSVRASIRPSSVQYFYGRITREEAEQFLQERGGKEGLFLLRESISPMGNYAISICHGTRVHHYSIEKQVDGLYKIPEGKPFPGPVELIQHYQTNMDGFVTQPKVPCNRFSGQSPVAFRGITYHQLEKAMQIEAKKINADVDRAMGPMRDTLVKRVASTLHSDMPWFHHKISRQEAETRLARDGHEDGKFIVRQRDEKNTFALTLSSEGVPRHYFIAQRTDSRFAIEDGPRFDCLMMLVDNYHNKSDGLACKLRMPCCRPGYSSIDYEQYMIHNSARKDSFRSKERPPGATNIVRRPSRDLPPIPPEGRRPLPSTPDSNGHGSFSNGRVSISEDSHPDVQLDFSGQELENVYGDARIREAVTTKKLEPSQIHLEELKLGAGNFGSVMQGVCKVDGRAIPVAVKTLKKADLDPGVQSELLKEAEVMKAMDHKHIVRMIGVCEGEPMMLVLELAKLGPLNKYLPKHKELPLWNILELMWQVAQGMEYLEKSNFVHRDLAARNILLCDQHFAKISDFGMSKTLTRENSYYVAQQAGKWPLKWYALECINYWKFDSKSDVWSFGITLWEAASYGSKPYYKMKGQEMVEFLQQGNRLSKPISCTEEVYQAMLQCWTENRDERPTFKRLVPMMEDLYRTHKAAGI